MSLEAATTTWVKALDAGEGGCIDPENGTLRYIYSANEPTAAPRHGRPIKRVDSQEWLSAPANIWVCGTTSRAVSYYLNKYTDLVAD